MNVKQYYKDLAYGSFYELQLIKQFETLFDMKLHNYEDKNAIHDFYIRDKNNVIIGLVELKTRRIKKDQYDTIMMGHNKLIEGKKRVKEENNIRFVVYIWGLDNKYGAGKSFYYWIETLDIEDKQYYIDHNGNRSRGDKDKKVCMVYTEYLKPLKHLLTDLKNNDFI